MNRHDQIDQEHHDQGEQLQQEKSADPNPLHIGSEDAEPFATVLLGEETPAGVSKRPRLCKNAISGKISLSKLSVEER